MEQVDGKCDVSISMLTYDSLMAASDFRPEKEEDSLIYYENGQRVAVADTTRLSMKKPLFFQNVDKFCYGVRPQLLFPTIFVGFDGKLAQKSSSAATAPYQWSNAKVKYFGLCVENLHKMKGKLHLLFNALATRLSQMGTEVKGNNGAKVYQLRNGKRAFLAMEPQRVFVLCGRHSSCPRTRCCTLPKRPRRSQQFFLSALARACHQSCRFRENRGRKSPKCSSRISLIISRFLRAFAL